MPTAIAMNDGGRGLFAATSAYADRATAGAPLKGTGYLAGESPSGLATVDLAPAACEIRVHYRPKSGIVGDGLLVAKTMSDTDGTWLVEGLDMSKRYDVIARYGGYKDVIASDVAPYRASSTQTVSPKAHIAYSAGRNPFGMADIQAPLSFSRTAAQLQFGGADASTTITDDKGVMTWTAYGNAQIDAAEGPNAQGALLLDGTGDYIESSSGAATLVGQSFCIEGYFKLDAYPAAGSSLALISRYTSAANRLLVYLGNSVTNDSGLRMMCGNGATQVAGGHPAQTATLLSLGITLGTWHHFAVTYDGTVGRVYLNGVLLGTTIAATSFTAGLGGTTPYRAGAYFDASLAVTGRMAGIRITTGHPRYTDTIFKNPSLPYPSS